MRLSDIKRELTDAKIENAEAEGRILFSHFENYDINKLFFEDPEVKSKELLDALIKRKERYPLQYIIGEVVFFREKYKVGPGCLIPRQDTEILVEKAIELLPKGVRFTDLCTGSGCIATSVLCNRSDLSANAADISKDAIEIAKENAKLNGVSERISFFESDVLYDCSLYNNEEYITANPPYISDEEMKTREKELSYEPEIALRADGDGLIFYKTIVSNAKKAKMIIFEIGYNQAQALKEIAKTNGFNAEIYKDYGKNDRVAILKR